ncbi:MAG: MOSC domain-containing protein [Thermoanaerobaculia bacterium]
MTAIGRVCDLVRYPVKSMAGTPIQSAYLGLHGIAGDRRFAFRRIGDGGGFPFLTASRFPELLTYRPIGVTEESGEPLPTHVRTRSGSDVELRGEELRSEIARESGHAVELMMFKHGIFDDGAISLISMATIAAIGREAAMEIDRRRMRANVVLETDSQSPFLEDDWVGATILFGDGAEAPAVSVTARDERCVMVNLDPDTGRQDPRVMKAVVRMNDNYAGVYGTVVRAGSIHVGQTVHLVPRTIAP